MDLTTWPATAAELEAVQAELARRWELEPRWRPGPRLLAGGVYAAPRRGLVGLGAAGDRAWAAAVAYDGERFVDTATLEGRFADAYRPGYLALREGPLLERAVRALSLRPDVLLVNATGLDHPRRAGLAIHLGAVLDLPTIGVTDRRLTAPGEELARTVVTRRGSRPLVVHPGWHTDLADAVDVVLGLCRSARTPEPLREARRLVRGLRAADPRAR